MKSSERFYEKNYIYDCNIENHFKMKRLFDFIISFFGLLILSPFLVLIALVIKLTSSGTIIYKQIRVGKNNRDFTIYKFKTMVEGAEKLGLLTIGNHDPRITKFGYYLRRYKLDELPQLFNVLIGNMSLVGPRPELRKYVNFYKQDQLNVLNYKPGITGLASLEFIDECALLAKQKDPEAYFIEVIIPKKAQINLKYHQQSTFLSDLQIIFKTLF